MQLESLASGNPERSVAQIPRDPVVRKVLLRAQRPARQLGAHHEHPRLIQILLFSRRPLVAIVLLIGTVELQELIFIVGKVRLVPEQSFLNRPSQGVTFRLDFFDVFGGHGKVDIPYRDKVFSSARKWF